MDTRPRGTEDVLPAAAARWRRLEAVCHELCRRYGYGEVRTPVFEHAEVFRRSLGEATDVVQKETYDFTDRGGRALTLRPEGTAPVVRAVLQNGLLSAGLPLKLAYVGYAAFRHERPQAGRLRQFHQFGCELFGSADPAADAELICLIADLLGEVGLAGWTVRLNSIGDDACRPRYRQALQAYYRPLLPSLCGDCRDRFERNPLRLLDCKVDRQAVAAAPRAVDHLCADCATHFARLCAYLDELGIGYVVDPTLVRGFDYYTRTVFEFVHGELGAQNSILGGGRYDGLVAAFGGPPTPACGFAVGMERLLLLVGERLAAGAGPDVYLAAVGAAPRRAGLRLAREIRAAGLAVETDLMNRSLKAQLRAADRCGARLCAILGEDELSRGVAVLRELRGEGQRELPLADLREAIGR